MATKKARKAGAKKRGGAASGSAKMLEKRVGAGAALQKSEVKGLLNILRRFNINLEDFFPIGRPQIELVRGSFSVPATDFNAAIGELITARGVRPRIIKVFPIGVIEIDRYRIEFEAAKQLGR